MMAGQHTPGPWTVVRNDFADSCIASADGKHVVCMGHDYDECGMIVNPCDVPLIAAAPDLLAALKDCCAALGGVVAHPEAIPASALIAIAKAEGR